ncbi:hypothetical protein GCM10009547_16120 [Sporichthya brevicatena]|uniref:Uncharacterized protein n=1 Tax=Sporichthya brevicatena TaxID=171442 RepID=A0ABN1GN72_9ACTN
MNETSDLSAWIIVFSGSLACVALAMAWAVGAVGARRPRAHRHLTGRPAVPYWHSPTGLQDERGITPLPDRRS